jgi:class 3 adenylate cyclase/tetratricopeptide (TPR) repeat protein
MRCTSCQAPLPDRARFCPSCGTYIPSGDPQEVRKTVTVLFCDIAGSTALSERLDPEALRGVILRYFALMRDCLEGHGAVVEKFIGDAVMAVFGIPAVHEDDALRAIRAAVAAHGALEQLNDQLASQTGIRIAVKIGINTGEVVTSGGPPGEQVLAAGETVNIAARLQQHAGLGETLLGSQTLRAAANAVIAEPVGPLRVKGISGGLQAHRLLDLLPDSPALARRFDVPLVDRVRELADLELILDRAAEEPSGHLVTLYGDAGIGKSRLAREYAVVASRRGALTSAGRCRATGEGGSLLALAEALRPMAGRAYVPGADAGNQALAVLRSGLLSDGTPGRVPGETTWAACRMLESLGGQQPILLVLDDLQWADQLLLDMLTAIAEALATVPVVILCLARTEFLAQRPGWGSGLINARSVLLGPLSTVDSHTLITELSDARQPPDAAIMARIADRAEGNALFIEQLMALLADGTDPGALPPTISLLIAARLDLLDTAGRATLAGASVVGREFTDAALCAAGEEIGEQPGGRDDLGQVLAALCRRRLIERTQRAGEAETSYRFCNGMIAEVAYRSLPKRIRARVHERLAGWYGAEGAANLEISGTHLERACANLADLGPPDARAIMLADQAAAQLSAAGAHALSRGDLARAGNLLDRALALCPADGTRRLPITARLAEVKIADGRIEEGRQLLREALGTPERAENRQVTAHARLQLAYLEPSRDQLAAAAKAASDALPVFAECHDELGLARAWTRIGQASQANGRYGAAIRELERALVHAVNADAELERATVLGALAISYWLGPGTVRTGIAMCRSLRDTHAQGRRAVQVALNCPLAVQLAMDYEFGPARNLVAVAGEITAELGHAYAAATVPIFGAAIESLAGEWAAAEQMLRDAVQRCAELGDEQLAATAVRDLARDVLWQGRHAEALELASALPADVAMPVAAADVHGIVARALAASGQAEEPRRLAAAAVAAARRTDSIACQATAQLDTAYVLVALGAAAEARASAGQALRAFARKGHLPGTRWAASLTQRIG